MSKFDDYWQTIAGSFSSESVAYFTKPMLRDAFNAGRKIGQNEMKKSTSREDRSILFPPGAEYQ